MTTTWQLSFIVLGYLLSSLPFNALSEPDSYTDKLPFKDLVGHSPWGFVDLGSNSEKAIQTELLDRSLLVTIAKAKGMSDPQMKTVVFEKDKITGESYLYQIGSDSRAFYAVADILLDYTTRRKEGYSTDLLLLGMTNRAPASADSYVTRLSQQRPFLPVSALLQRSFDVKTNEAGRVDGLVSYTLTDNGLKWTYMIHLREDGTIAFCFDRRDDAKEDDPKFRRIFLEVEAEVDQAMSADGTKGQFGSGLGFERLKKAKLEQRGILWRTPSELNPCLHRD